MKKGKILVITPRYPFDMLGACGQDRAHGVLLLKRAGYDVEVITMVFKRHLPLIEQAEKDFGVTITPIVHSEERDTRYQKIAKLIQRIFVPLYWDGAAFEYRDSEIQRVVREKIDSYAPDLVWFDYTYLWPLYSIPKSKGIPIITRSINFEPDHFLGKVQKNIITVLKYWAKLRGERKMLDLSDVIFSITPKEKLMYERMTKKKVLNMPLRRLGSFIGMNVEVRERENLNVCFMGANYGVHHMLQALNFILNTVNPLLQERLPNRFTIHVIGGKLPEKISSKKYNNVVFHGYVPDLDEFLSDMDIALSPSLSGEGMQQKVFEPIVRGIPTITSERALAGYPFYDGIHVLTASDNPEDFISAFTTLTSAGERRRLSQNAVAMSQHIFNEDMLIQIIDTNIIKLLHTT